MTSWAEIARDDKSLQAYVDAEVARAHVRLQSLETENEHQREVIAEQQRRIKHLEAITEEKTTKKARRGTSGA